MQHGRITIADKQIVVTCPPHVAIRLRRLFGGAQRYKPGVFQLSATPEQAYDLEWFRERHPLDIDPKCEERFRELIATHEKRLAAIAALDTEGYIPAEFQLALPPRHYQRVAADLALRTRGLLLADDLGIGKTVSAICTLTAPGALPALVVTMTHLTRQWERELHRFAPKLRVHRIRSGEPYKFSDIKVEVDATTKRRRVVNGGVPDVLLVNYQKLGGWVENLAGLCRTVIFDETQELRHAGTRKYEAATHIAHAADLRIGLTATPIYNYGIEIFNVVNAVAPDQLGTKQEFVQEWCGEAVMGADDRKLKVSDPAALGTYLREAGIMLRRTRKDVGRELPALTKVRHVVETDEQQLDKAVADVAELARRVLDRIGTNLERMQSAGELDYRLRQATGIAKAPAVADFVRLLVEAGESVVLFGWHHEVYRLWSSSFERAVPPIPYAMYTGKESDAQKEAARDRFCKGEAKVLIISLRAGAGLDGLQFACRTVVHGELDWSPGVHQQDDGRVHRDGQTEPVMSYYLVAEEGSDPVIADVLGIKEAQAAGIRDPDQAGTAEIAAGASTDHIRRLAEDVLRRRQQQRRTG
jgi:SNF2 family DNA or RNA helicase